MLELQCLVGWFLNDTNKPSLIPVKIGRLEASLVLEAILLLCHKLEKNF